jgi:hypothetical protein
MLKLFVLNNILLKNNPQKFYEGKLENPLGYSEIFNVQHGNLNFN